MGNRFLGQESRGLRKRARCGTCRRHRRLRGAARAVVNIAQAYVQLQRAYLQLDIAEATLKQRDQVYALTRDRNAAGVDSLLEVKQAESALPATREADRAMARGDRARAEPDRRSAGRGSRSRSRHRAAERHAGASVALPSALPAELLGRRPDLTAQRLRIEALSHDIASARAEFYPNVNLAAFIGLQSLGAAGSLSGASRMAGFGPAVTLPIFDAGRLRGNLAAKTPATTSRSSSTTRCSPMRCATSSISSPRSAASTSSAGAGARCRHGPPGVRPRTAALSRRHRQLSAGADDRGAMAVAAEPGCGTAGAPASAFDRSRARIGWRFRPGIGGARAHAG